MTLKVRREDGRGGGGGARNTFFSVTLYNFQKSSLSPSAGDFFYAHFKMADAYFNCGIAQTETYTFKVARKNRN